MFPGRIYRVDELSMQTSLDVDSAVWGDSAVWELSRRPAPAVRATSKAFPTCMGPVQCVGAELCVTEGVRDLHGTR